MLLGVADGGCSLEMVTGPDLMNREDLRLTHGHCLPEIRCDPVHTGLTGGTWRLVVVVRRVSGSTLVFGHEFYHSGCVRERQEERRDLRLGRVDNLAGMFDQVICRFEAVIGRVPDAFDDCGEVGPSIHAVGQGYGVRDARCRRLSSKLIIEGCDRNRDPPGGDSIP